MNSARETVPSLFASSSSKSARSFSVPKASSPLQSGRACGGRQRERERIVAGLRGLRRRQRLKDPALGLRFHSSGGGELFPGQRHVSVRVDAFETRADLLERAPAEVFGHENLMLLHLPAPGPGPGPENPPVIVSVSGVQRLEQRTQLLQRLRVGRRRRLLRSRGGTLQRNGERQPGRSDELVPRQRRVAVRVDAFESAADLLQRATAKVLGKQGLVLLHLLAPLLACHLPVAILIQRVEEIPQFFQALGGHFLCRGRRKSFLGIPRLAAGRG